MKFTVDQDICIGCGTCESIFTSVFKLVENKSQEPSTCMKSITPEKVTAVLNQLL